jgi:mRNA interferase MazF
MGSNHRRRTRTEVRRGEIRLADLEPARGSEANKRRPVVLVSNDGANARAEALGRGVVTVVPVTSNVRRVLAFQTLLEPDATGLGRLSKAQAEQIRSIDVTRLGDRIGQLTPDLIHELDDALRLHLHL